MIRQEKVIRDRDEKTRDLRETVQRKERELQAHADRVTQLEREAEEAKKHADSDSDAAQPQHDATASAAPDDADDQNDDITLTQLSEMTASQSHAAIAHADTASLQREMHRVAQKLREKDEATAAALQNARDEHKQLHDDLREDIEALRRQDAESKEEVDRLSAELELREDQDARLAENDQSAAVSVAVQPNTDHDEQYAMGAPGDRDYLE